MQVLQYSILQWEKCCPTLSLVGTEKEKNIHYSSKILVLLLPSAISPDRGTSVGPLGIAEIHLKMDPGIHQDLKASNDRDVSWGFQNVPGLVPVWVFSFLKWILDLDCVCVAGGGGEGRRAGQGLLM